MTCHTFSCVPRSEKRFLLRLSPLRSGLQAMFTSSWWVQSCCSHSLLTHSSKLGSFPVQLTSSKWIGPDPIPPSPSGKVSPDLHCGEKKGFMSSVIDTKTNVPLKVWNNVSITCNQAAGTPPECWSLSSHRHKLSPTDHGKRLLYVLGGSQHPQPISQYRLQNTKRVPLQN